MSPLIGATLPTSECEDSSAKRFAPRFQEAYFSHFDEFRRKLRKLEALEEFFLVPVDVPSRDVGRALVQYLEEHGSSVLVVKPSSWRNLVLEVLRLPRRDQDPRSVMIFGPRDWGKEFPQALNALNFKRDAIVEHLKRPLIWCGLRFFMDVMWDHAPDFWSIRNITTKIPLESEFHTPLRTSLDPFTRPMVRLRNPQSRKFPTRRSAAHAWLEYIRSLLVHARAHEATKPLREVAKILVEIKKSTMTLEDAEYRELDADVALALEKDTDAERAYSLALEAHRDTGDQHGEARVLAKMGRLANISHEHSKAGGLFHYALKLADELGDLSLRAGILQARGSDPQNIEQTRAALVDMDKAVNLFDQVGDDFAQNRALVTRAFLRYDVADHEGATADLDRAIPAISVQDSPIAWTNAHVLRGILYYDKGDFAQAKDVFDMLLRSFGYARHPSVRAFALIQSGRTRQLLDDHDAAEKNLTEAIELIGSKNHPTLLANAYFDRCWVRHSLKKWELAEYDSQIALNLFLNHPHSQESYKFSHRLAYQYYFFYAHMLAHAGKLERALTTYADAIDAADKASNQVIAEILGNRASVWAKQGDFEKAWNDFEKAIVLLKESEAASEEGDLRVRRAATCLADNSSAPPRFFAALQVDLERVIHELRPNVSPICLADAYFLRGKLSLLTEKQEQARADFNVALAKFEALEKSARMLEVLGWLHIVDEMLHNYAEAQTDLERIVRIAEKHAGTTAALQLALAKAALAEKSGDVEIALRILRNARNDLRSSNGAIALIDITMAKIHYRHGRLGPAQRLARRALQRAKNQPWEDVIKAHARGIESSDDETLE